MRLIFPETKHPGLQFEHKNETIQIRIESDMIFRSWLYRLLQQLRENRTLLAPHSHQSPHLMHQIFPKAKMRSMFMIFCQPSLNDFSFIFLPPLLYIPLLSFIQRHKNPIFSPLLSSSEVEQSCHILVFLRLKVLNETHSSSPNSSFPLPLGPPSGVSFSTIWILHEGIIHFPNCFLCCHDENLGLRHDSNYLNPLVYV